MGELIVFHHNLLKGAKKPKNRKQVKMQDKCQIVQDFPKLHFIGKFDIFPLISPSDIVSIIGLTLILENIGQCDIT